MAGDTLTLKMNTAVVGRPSMALHGPWMRLFRVAGLFVTDALRVASRINQAASTGVWRER